MQYAMLGNQKLEAAPGLFGECPGCKSRVLAKCDTQRVWHWAHLGKITCNFEREPETKWHRNWKNDFPVEWREVIRSAQTGERHRADVMTELGLVIEFQHSPLHSNERIAREFFHPNMVWVVDGTRLHRTWGKFLQGQRSWINIYFRFRRRLQTKFRTVNLIERLADIPVLTAGVELHYESGYLTGL